MKILTKTQRIHQGDSINLIELIYKIKQNLNWNADHQSNIKKGTQRVGDIEDEGDGRS